MQTIPWSRFVAVGDSLTEGVGDPVGGALRGWADRVAEALRAANPDLEYWNLARRSLTTEEIGASQLELALDLKPDLVSVVAGMNDLLSGRFEADTYRSSLMRIVGPLAETDATLLMGTFPNDMPVLRLMTRRRADAFRAHLRAVGEVVKSVATEHGALCIGSPAGWSYRWADCSIDGCHPNARGHALIARLALEALGERAGIELVNPDPGQRWLSTSLGHLRWLWGEGYLHKPPPVLAWITRRGA